MPSLARSVAKPLKVPSLARSVPKPLLIELREAGGHQPGTYEPLLIFAVDLLPAGRRKRGTSTDSSKLSSAAKIKRGS